MISRYFYKREENSRSDNVFVLLMRLFYHQARNIFKYYFRELSARITLRNGRGKIKTNFVPALSKDKSRPFL